METVLLYSRNCHAWNKAAEELELALVETQNPVDYRVKMIETKDDAREFKFIGSPTIQINGEDVDPSAQSIKEYNIHVCRTYSQDSATFDYPTKQMILNHIEKLKAEDRL